MTRSRFDISTHRERPINVDTVWLRAHGLQAFQRLLRELDDQSFSRIDLIGWTIFFVKPIDF